MSFLAVVLALLLDQWLRHLEPVRSPRWFHAYAEAFAGMSRRADPVPATAVALAMVLVPSVIVMFLFDLLHGLWAGDLLSYLFAVAVFLFCLGPRDLHVEVEAYMDAVQAGDEARAAGLAVDILGAAAPATPRERTQAVTRAVFSEANDRMFGPLFWFGLLGPGGAVLYRSTDLLKRVPADEASGVFRHAVERLYGVLAWVPAHLTALGYALAGSFEDAVSDLKAYYNACTLQFFQVNNDVLVCTGLGAIRASAGEDAGAARLKSALGLVRRTLLIWIVMLGLFTILGLSW